MFLVFLMCISMPCKGYVFTDFADFAVGCSGGIVEGGLLAGFEVCDIALFWGGRWSALCYVGVRERGLLRS